MFSDAPPTKIVCLANRLRVYSHTRPVVNGEPRDRRERVSEPGLGEAGRGMGHPRRVPPEIRNVSFPVSARGYDRRSVDAYIIRVNRLIAELEATRSPGAVLRHALEEAEEQTDAIIQQAREMAAEITSGAWTEAEEITARAKAEAADIVVNADAAADRARAAADAYVARAAEEAKEILAGSEKEAEERRQRSGKQIAELWEEAETWLSKLRADTEALWGERRALLDDVREIAARLEEAASTAAVRFPSEEAAEPSREKREAADAGPTEQLPKQ
jgi:DivIVA domain-containing protein